LFDLLNRFGPEAWGNNCGKVLINSPENSQNY
jgi:hypothetical protein